MMMRTVDSTHVGFVRQITGKRERQKSDGSWETSAAKEVLQALGTRLLATYIGHQQAMAAQLVSLQPLLEVRARKTGYEGGRHEETAVMETGYDSRVN